MLGRSNEVSEVRLTGDRTAHPIDVTPDDGVLGLGRERVEAVRVPDCLVLPVDLLLVLLV